MKIAIYFHVKTSAQFQLLSIKSEEIAWKKKHKSSKELDSQTRNEGMWKTSVSWVWKWLWFSVKKAQSFSRLSLYHFYCVGCFQAAQNHFTTRAPSSNCSIFLTHTVVTAVKYLNFQTYSISIQFSFENSFFFFSFQCCFVPRTCIYCKESAADSNAFTFASSLGKINFGVR